jgi:hypothetical protein
MSRFACILAFLLFLPSLASAQLVTSNQHVLPWFIDGRIAPGSGYRTELVISNPNFVFANCSLQLGGLTARFENLAGPIPGASAILNITVFPAGYDVIRTQAAQPLGTGYGILNCSTDVYVTERFSFFTGDNASSPVAEAAVPSSFGDMSVEYIYDHRNGARLGIALANPYSTPAVFSLNVLGSVTGTWYISVPAATVVTRFLDEWVPLPANATGKVVISDYFSSRSVYSIGLKYTGQSFSAVFPNVRVP